MSDTFFQFLPQQLVNGLTLGSLYALIAIGYTMVYGIIGMINFAHGEIYMIGAYIGLIVMSALMMWGVDALPMLLALAFIVSIGFSGMYGWTLERVAYRQLRGRHRLIPLISAIGMSIFLQNFMQLGQGARDVALPQLLSGGFEFALAGSPLYVSYIQVVIWTVNIAAMVLLALFIGRTRLGRACRATSQDRLMASLLGIDTDRVISVTFIIGAMLAAVAGVLVILYYGVANAYMGFIIGIKAFTAAVLGGIGSIPGAVIGGLLLGFSESFASAFLSTEYKDVVAFCLLIVVLLFRPTGILGKPEVEKV